jgi:hypothetical protein
MQRTLPVLAFLVAIVIATVHVLEFNMSYAMVLLTSYNQDFATELSVQAHSTALVTSSTDHHSNAGLLLVTLALGNFIIWLVIKSIYNRMWIAPNPNLQPLQVMGTFHEPMYISSGDESSDTERNISYELIESHEFLEEYFDHTEEFVQQVFAELAA